MVPVKPIQNSQKQCSNPHPLSASGSKSQNLYPGRRERSNDRGRRIERHTQDTIQAIKFVQRISCVELPTPGLAVGSNVFDPYSAPWGPARFQRDLPSTHWAFCPAVAPIGSVYSWKDVPIVLQPKTGHSQHRHLCLVGEQGNQGGWVLAISRASIRGTEDQDSKGRSVHSRHGSSQTHPLERSYQPRNSQRADKTTPCFLAYASRHLL